MLDQIIGGGLMMGADALARNQQQKQQEKYQMMSAEQARNQTLMNHNLGLEFWNKTNVEAQAAHIKNAGLNLGLMYKGTGAGGATQNSGSNAPMAQAPVINNAGMGMQLGMQAQMQQAQINNMNADTKLKEVEAGKRAGIDTQEGQQRVLESQKRMEAIAQSITNAQTQNTINQYEAEIKGVQAKYANESTEAGINQLKTTTQKLVEEITGQKQRNEITEATMQDVIKQAKLTMIGQSLMNELTREKVINTTAMTEETWAKIGKISAEIDRMTAQTEQGSRGLDQNDQRILLEQIQNEFSYGEHAQIIRWIGAIGGAVGDIASMVSRGRGLKLQEKAMNEKADQFNRKAQGQY